MELAGGDGGGSLFGEYACVRHVIVDGHVGETGFGGMYRVCS